MSREEHNKVGYIIYLISEFAKIMEESCNDTTE